jgi:hypothetical protein
LFVGVLTGCATPGLTPRAREVQLLTETPERLQEEYEEISVLSCRRDLNVGDLDTNVIQCQDQLKNEAARLGGDLLIVNEQELGRAGCESCVTIVATAYRRK